MGDSISNLGIESLSGAYTKYSGTTVNTDNGDDQSSYLDFDSYLKLLVAKMSNQDFNDPMSDSEMLQQMSSYSMLEGIKNMTAQSNISYATSLVGKAVTVNDGSDYDTGIVESVVVEDNTPYLIVNGSRYNASTVSDITSSDIYGMMESLIGRQVDITTTDESGAESKVSGKVTNVLLLGGDGYVIIDGKNKYPLSSVSLRNDDTGSGSSENNADAGDLVTNESSVEASNSRGYIEQSEALFSDLMSTIDSISGQDKAVEGASEVSSDTGDIFEGYETVTVTQLDVPDYAAATFAESENIVETLSVDSVTPMATQSQSNDQVVSNANIYSAIANSGGSRVSSILTNEQVLQILNDSSYQVRYSKYGLEVKSDTRPGILTSDSVPNRKDADKYPEEAALADMLGTKMYDIKYINNTAITSRIDTSEVVGRTISGRGICEIGYSGVGQLGEVVTFENGTQRVEVLLKNGNSCWLETTGNYTLDEICNPYAAPGSLTGKLTPFESAIRNYAIKDTLRGNATGTLAEMKSMLLKYGVGNIVDT